MKCGILNLFLAALLFNEVKGDLRFRQWWKAVRNTPSCIPYVREYSWTWIPSKNNVCENGRPCDFPKEICMSYTERPSDVKCQRVPTDCYSDASLFFCPGRHQEFKECGSKCPKSCMNPRETCQDECTPGCYCKDPWTLVRSERSVCVRKDHCHYFVDVPGSVPSWDTEFKSKAKPAQQKQQLDSSTQDLHFQRVSSIQTQDFSRPEEVEPAPEFTSENFDDDETDDKYEKSVATAVPLYPGQSESSEEAEELAVRNGNPPDACIKEGTRYPLGAEQIAREYPDAAWPYSLVHVCVGGGRSAKWSPVACLDDRNRRVEIGQTFLDGKRDFLLRCDNQAGIGLSVRAISCVYQNDTFFPDGSSWTVANIVQRCSLSESGPGSEIGRVGCVDDFGKSVEHGAEFRTKDGLHYRRCTRGQDDVWRVVIVGCIDSGQERRRCDQDYSIYARLKLAGYAKKLCALCNSYVSDVH